MNPPHVAVVVALWIGASSAQAQFDCLGVNGGTALPGTPCDDGLSQSTNDTWTPQCVCIGMCWADWMSPGVWGPPGTPCDDANFLTIEDMWGPGCICAGIGMDCLGVFGGTDQPGSSCDDGDPDTMNDTWSPNCVCVGDQSTSMEQLGTISVRIWPDPASDLLRITAGIGNTSVRLWIIDQQGRMVVVSNRPLIHGVLEVPLIGLADGMYTLRLEGPGVRSSHRFVFGR